MSRIYHLTPRVKPAATTTTTAGTRFTAAAPSAALPEKDRQPYPRRTAEQGLTKQEMVPLAILIGDAFKELVRLDPGILEDAKASGLTRAQFEANWRHSQIKYCTSNPQPHPAGVVTGLSKAKRAHWECIAAHFCAMLGRDVESFRHSMRDGKAPGRAGQDGDLRGDLRQALTILRKEMDRLKINDAYVAAIIAGKYHQRTLESLTRKEVWQVTYTIRNRAANRDDRGDPDKRNKSQRAAQASARKARQPVGIDDTGRIVTADADDVGF